jgi:hypothetical protein
MRTRQLMLWTWHILTANDIFRGTEDRQDTVTQPWLVKGHISYSSDVLKMIWYRER